MNKFQIESIKGREILDSRGVPTVEVDVVLLGGHIGRAAVPSGASTGSHEAIELRDKDKNRYHGRGVLKAVGHVNAEIQYALKGKDARDQEALDKCLIDLDGSKDGNKARLGANAILAVSLAIAHAASSQSQIGLYEYIRKNLYKDLREEKHYILPRPMMNFINGGAHANNVLDFQEFLLIPHGADSFEQQMEWASTVFRHWQTELRKNQSAYLNAFSYGVGDEGGYSITFPGMAPRETVRYTLNILSDVVARAGYKMGRNEQFAIAMDPAASEFFDGKSYVLGGRIDKDKEEIWSSEELVGFYEELVNDFPIESIEDGMAENDEEGWRLLTQRIGDRCQLVGDDLFVTNPRFLQEGIRKKIANAILVKVNQIGTLTEVLDVIKIAQANGYERIVSHRSGETEDTTISDLAVAVNAGQIKTGCLARADRVCKYNRLLNISQELGDLGQLPGKRKKEDADSSRAA